MEAISEDEDSLEEGEIPEIKNVSDISDLYETISEASEPEDRPHARHNAHKRHHTWCRRQIRPLDREDTRSPQRGDTHSPHQGKSQSPHRGDTRSLYRRDTRTPHRTRPRTLSFRKRRRDDFDDMRRRYLQRLKENHRKEEVRKDQEVVIQSEVLRASEIEDVEMEVDVEEVPFVPREIPVIDMVMSHDSDQLQSSQESVPSTQRPMVHPTPEIADVISTQEDISSPQKNLPESDEDSELIKLRAQALNSWAPNRHPGNEWESDPDKYELNLRSEALKTAVLKKRSSIIRKKEMIKNRKKQKFKESNASNKTMGPSQDCSLMEVEMKIDELVNKGNKNLGPSDEIEAKGKQGLVEIDDIAAKEKGYHGELNDITAKETENEKKLDNIEVKSNCNSEDDLFEDEELLRRQLLATLPKKSTTLKSDILPSNSQYPPKCISAPNSKFPPKSVRPPNSNLQMEFSIDTDSIIRPDTFDSQTVSDVIKAFGNDSESDENSFEVSDGPLSRLGDRKIRENESIKSDSCVEVSPLRVESLVSPPLSIIYEATKNLDRNPILSHSDMFSDHFDPKLADSCQTINQIQETTTAAENKSKLAENSKKSPMETSLPTKNPTKKWKRLPLAASRDEKASELHEKLEGSPTNETELANSVNKKNLAFYKKSEQYLAETTPTASKRRRTMSPEKSKSLIGDNISPPPIRRTSSGDRTPKCKKDLKDDPKVSKQARRGALCENTNSRPSIGNSNFDRSPVNKQLSRNARRGGRRRLSSGDKNLRKTNTIYKTSSRRPRTPSWNRNSNLSTTKHKSTHENKISAKNSTERSSTKSPSENVLRDKTQEVNTDSKNPKQVESLEKNIQFGTKDQFKNTSSSRAVPMPHLTMTVGDSTKFTTKNNSEILPNAKNKSEVLLSKTDVLPKPKAVSTKCYQPFKVQCQLATASQRIVIPVGPDLDTDSDQDDDCEEAQTTNEGLGNLDYNVDQYLMNIRRKTDEKTLPTTMPQTPEAVHTHLSLSGRLEYMRLKQKLADKEKSNITYSTKANSPESANIPQVPTSEEISLNRNNKEDLRTRLLKKRKSSEISTNPVIAPATASNTVTPPLAKSENKTAPTSPVKIAPGKPNETVSNQEPISKHIPSEKNLPIPSKVDKIALSGKNNTLPHQVDGENVKTRAIETATLGKPDLIAISAKVASQSTLAGKIPSIPPQAFSKITSAGKDLVISPQVVSKISSAGKNAALPPQIANKNTLAGQNIVIPPQVFGNGKKILGPPQVFSNSKSAGKNIVIPSKMVPKNASSQKNIAVPSASNQTQMPVQKKPHVLITHIPNELKPYSPSAASKTNPLLPVNKLKLVKNNSKMTEGAEMEKIRQLMTAFQRETALEIKAREEIMELRKKIVVLEQKKQHHSYRSNYLRKKFNALISKTESVTNEVKKLPPSLPSASKSTALKISQTATAKQLLQAPSPATSNKESRIPVVQISEAQLRLPNEASTKMVHHGPTTTAQGGPITRVADAITRSSSPIHGGLVTLHADIVQGGPSTLLHDTVQGGPITGTTVQSGPIAKTIQGGPITLLDDTVEGGPITPHADTVQGVQITADPTRGGPITPEVSNGGGHLPSMSSTSDDATTTTCQQLLLSPQNPPSIWFMEYRSPLPSMDSAVDALWEVCCHDLSGLCRDSACIYQHIPTT